jgi:hypothetical protein
MLGTFFVNSAGLFYLSALLEKKQVEHEVILNHNAYQISNNCDF